MAKESKKKKGMNVAKYLIQIRDFNIMPTKQRVDLFRWQFLRLKYGTEYLAPRILVHLCVSSPNETNEEARGILNSALNASNLWIHSKISLYAYQARRFLCFSHEEKKSLLLIPLFVCYCCLNVNNWGCCRALWLPRWNKCLWSCHCSAWCPSFWVLLLKTRR